MISKVKTTEYALVEKVLEFFGEEGYRTRVEVANMGQSIDVVATKGRWVTVIEAKIKDWRRALRQCQAHEQVADYICLAVALKSIPDLLLKDASKLGYGIIHYQPGSKSAKWVLRPLLNKNIWRPQRSKWSQHLREVPYVN